MLDGLGLLHTMGSDRHLRFQTNALRRERFKLAILKPNQAQSGSETMRLPVILLCRTGSLQTARHLRRQAARLSDRSVSFVKCLYSRSYLRQLRAFLFSNGFSRLRATRRVFSRFGA